MSRYGLSRKHPTSAGRREPRGHHSQLDWNRRVNGLKTPTSTTLQRLEAALAAIDQPRKATV